MLPLLTRRDLLAPPAPASAAPTVPESLARHGGGAAAARTSPLRERLVFLNDVFFCADDVLRLVMHDQQDGCSAFAENPMEQCQAADAFHPAPHTVDPHTEPPDLTAI
eukprot:365459-Chlamydomonas_euryale.AAC.11